jgi:hypothetical protein
MLAQHSVPCILLTFKSNRMLSLLTVGVVDPHRLVPYVDL